MQAVSVESRRPAAGSLLVPVAIMTLAAGCDVTGSLGPRPDELAEVSIGEFRVPLAPGSDVQEADESTRRNHLLLRFQLHALVPPGYESVVTKRVASHEVRLRDEVLKTCRSASLDELSEPSLGALKARLTKAVERYFGPMHVRRVVISNVLLEPT